MRTVAPTPQPRSPVELVATTTATASQLLLPGRLQSSENLLTARRPRRTDIYNEERSRTFSGRLRCTAHIATWDSRVEIWIHKSQVEIDYRDCVSECGELFSFDQTRGEARPNRLRLDRCWWCWTKSTCFNSYVYNNPLLVHRIHSPLLKEGLSRVVKENRNCIRNNSPGSPFIIV